MKLQFIPTIKQGLRVIIKNPTILWTVILYAILNSIFIYFFIYAPGLIFTPEEMSLFPEHLIWYLILSSLISLFLLLIIIKMVYDAVVNNSVSFSEAISLSVRKFIFALIVFILYYLVVTFGFIALIIPGIFLIVKFAFVAYFILLSNEKIIDSFRKSWQITKGNWWEVFGLNLMFIIPVVILSIIANIIAIISVPIALVLDFVSLLLSGWFLSVFTIAYIQLTKTEEQEKIA